jgi:hypothetical protein
LEVAKLESVLGSLILESIFQTTTFNTSLMSTAATLVVHEVEIVGSHSEAKLDKNTRPNLKNKVRSKKGLGNSSG